MGQLGADFWGRWRMRKSNGVSNDFAEEEIVQNMIDFVRERGGYKDADDVVELVKEWDERNRPRLRKYGVLPSATAEAIWWRDLDWGKLWSKAGARAGTTGLGRVQGELADSERRRFGLDAAGLPSRAKPALPPRPGKGKKKVGLPGPAASPPEIMANRSERITSRPPMSVGAEFELAGGFDTPRAPPSENTLARMSTPSTARRLYSKRKSSRRKIKKKKSSRRKRKSSKRKIKKRKSGRRKIKR